MKRLIKKSYHDLYDRDCALIYINGEFIDGEIHAECVQKYFDKYPIKFKANIDHIEDRSDFDYELTNNEKLESLPFACMNIDQDDIFIEIDTLRNISVDELTNKLKSEYPGYHIYEDTDDYVQDYSAYKKLAKRNNEVIKC